MTAVQARVSEVTGLAATTRLKTRGTIIDKLHREKTNLARMQDIAGVRVVLPQGAALVEQDRAVDQVVDAFGDAEPTDRRLSPSFGYRAVHVVVRDLDYWVEVQVRTHLQDLWGQLVDRLSDAWGRQLRYGEPPDDADVLVSGELTRLDVLAVIAELSAVVYGQDTMVSVTRCHEAQVGGRRDELAERRLLLHYRAIWPGSPDPFSVPVSAGEVRAFDEDVDSLGERIVGLLRHLASLDAWLVR